MRGERGGQITMFVLLGLVILLVVGVLYIVATAQQERENLQDRIQGTIALSDMALIDRHVGSCLDTIVTDELRIIGDTGALSADGISAIVTEGTAQYRVGYGVTRNKDTAEAGVRPAESAPPRYPDRGVGIMNSMIDPLTGRPFPEYSGGFFGDVQFVAICDRDGPNRPHTSIHCGDSYPGSPGVAAGPSVQETLSRNIAQRVAACASSRVFEDALGRKVTQVGDATVNVTFHLDTLAVALQYPLEFDGDVVLQTAPIARKYDVRLLSLLQFATDLARQDSRNITFVPERDYRHLTNTWKAGFTVGRTPNVEVAPIGSVVEDADMITIRDSESVLFGQDYRFRFLVEHRIPMLDEMTNEEALRYFRVDNPETPTRPLAADPDDGLIAWGDPRIVVERPFSGSPTLVVVVYDADCPRPYTRACPYHDYLDVS